MPVSHPNAIKLSTLQINEREHEEVAHMLQIVSDMERISDYCENISEFAESLLESRWISLRLEWNI